MSSFGPFLLLLSPLVVAHELGHLLAAKLLGVKCERFAIGFGPALFRRRLGETELVLGWLPFGGYVKMLAELPGESLPPQDVGRSLTAQPPAARIAIAAAGPAASLLLSVAVIAGSAMTIGWPAPGPAADDVAIQSILDGSPAQRAGLEPGDRFLRVGGQPVSAFSQVQDCIQRSGGAPLAVEVLRNGGAVALEVVPERGPGQLARYAIGIRAARPAPPFERVRNPFAAVRRGAQETWEIVRETLDGLLALVTREVDAAALAGPLAIGQLAARAFAETGWFAFLRLMALISVNLAILNLLPVPYLDGGQIALATTELVRGGPLGARVSQVVHALGLSVILLIAGLAFWNDMARSWPSIASFFAGLL